jgi:UDP-glucuronate decarboxylase
MASELIPSRPVLVAGGAGFLGSHLCERLIGSGRAVLCVDSFITGELLNVQHLGRNASFLLQRHDISEPFETSEIGAIFNLACPASPVHYQADPIHTTMTSVRGTYNLLEMARQRKVRLLQASTSEVYGDPEVHPQPETYLGNVNPIGPRACYDEGKRAAETLMFDYHRMYGVEIKVARIFNTYGPRMLENDGRVVSNFIVQALRGEPITIYGGGTQTRSFCFVDDLVRGLQLLMESPSSITGPCNLGNPHEVTIEAIARDVLAYTESISPLRFEELPKDDPKRRKPVIDTAVRALGWRPRVALKDGLKATIAYFAMRMAGEAPALVPAIAPRRSGRTGARGQLTIADGQ